MGFTEDFLTGMVIGTVLNSHRRLSAQQTAAAINASTAPVPRTIRKNLGRGYSVVIPNPDYHEASDA